MKVLFAVFALLATFASPLSVRAQESLGGFVVDEIQMDATVRVDGVVDVTELMRVRFFEPRHGIVRTIPIRYTTDSGNRRSIKISLQSVERSGQPAQFTETESGDDLVIRAGDPVAMVEGSQTYRIRYTVDRTIVRFDDHDEWYWNVTGTDLPVVPKHVVAKIHLPSGVPGQTLKTACYTGGLGSTLQQCEATTGEDDKGAFAQFVAADFLTTVVGFEKGHVFVPNFFQSFLLFVQDNPVTTLPVIVLIVMFLWWHHRGRDPKTRAIVAEFEPPESLRPSEVGALVDGRVHDRDLSAAVVDWAVRGYLKIISNEQKGLLGTKRSFSLERTEKPIDDLKPYELALFEGFFGTETRVDLSKMSQHAKRISEQRKKAEHMLYDDLANRKWFSSNPERTRNAFVVVGVMLGGSAWFFAGLFSVATSVALVASGVIIALFGVIMPRRTEEGTRVFEKALGFQEYLSRAEKYRLEWQEKENIFEKYLPYAMVFGVVDKWTNALATVINQPDWYQGSPGSVWNALYFNSLVHDLSRDMNTAVGVKPNSGAAGGRSGFSGGFSGGGFGGGGTGSW